MFKKLTNAILGDPNKKMLNGLQVIVDEVTKFEPHYEVMTDEQLRDELILLRERVQSEMATVDDILPETFALVREASKRVNGQRHYDVQMMGGTLLHQGNVVEMRTGEGKTLTGTSPLVLNALKGNGVHLITVNDYLARRDGGWMGKIFDFLGLTVGCIGTEQFSGIYDPDYVNPGADLEDERLVHWRPCTRQEAYAADITYGTSSEFGFDYLRDNMVSERDKLVQRGLHCAFIDEVDNVLIDESRTPLIISGPASHTGKEYTRFSGYVRGLKENTSEEGQEPNGHFDLDYKSRSVTLTDSGLVEIEKRIEELDINAGDSIYDPRFFHLTYYLDNAMKAQYLFHRDQQYMVQESQVVIIDETTGRPMPSRRYSDGLHEAIEAKEKVEIQRETTTVATITLQNYFRMYSKLAGMTGTALTDAEEFDRIYGLGVFPMQTNVQHIVDTGSMGLKTEHYDDSGTKATRYLDPTTGSPRFYKRTDHPDQVFSTHDSKDDAIIREIMTMNETGRPVLVGTTSVEHSEKISRALKKSKIKHQVLNAKMHRSEALVVAQAGRKSAVTISTNMAGRGTDILLGGNAEGLSAGMLEDDMFDRPLLTQLAKTMITNGEDAARDMAEKSPKLDVNLVDGLISLQTSFDEASAEIAKAELAPWLARELHKTHGVDVAIAKQAVVYVRIGAVATAREYLQEQNVDTALAEEALHLYDLYNGWENAKGNDAQRAKYLAEQLFEENYTARAALIRAVLADDIKAADQVCETVPGLPTKWVQRVVDIRDATVKEREQVWGLGGLHVIGSERHESRRIDNQLRGRSARQGDPGSSRFFLSLEDDLMLRFGGERLKNFMNRFEIPDDMPIESSMIERLIENSQSRLEGWNFDIRKNLVEYDDVMAKQRETMYRGRRDILLSEEADLDGKIDEAFAGVIDDLAHNYLDDYQNFVSAEIMNAVDEYTAVESDKVNVRPVLVRLRGYLPQIQTWNSDDMENMSADALRNKLNPLVTENIENGTNVYQLLQAMRQFVPLLPRVPNVAAQLAGLRDRANGRNQIRIRFLKRVEELYDDFLKAQIPAADRDAIWAKTEADVNEAFVRFKVDGVSADQLKEQQVTFNSRVSDGLSSLLLEGLKQLDSDHLVEALHGYVGKRAADAREAIGEEAYRDFQRLLLLSSFDREWRDYLTAMDDLRREVGLEAYAQKDPKQMYKIRSFEMFQDMRRNINQNVAKDFFLRINDHATYLRQQAQQAKRTTQTNQSQAAGYQVVNRGKGSGTVVQREAPKLGRNDDCWCGSGKKYKHCHMKSDQQNRVPTSVAQAGVEMGSTPSKKINTQGKKKRRR